MNIPLELSKPLIDESQILVLDAERRAADYQQPLENPLIADAMKRAERANRE